MRKTKTTLAGLFIAATVALGCGAADTEDTVSSETGADAAAEEKPAKKSAGIGDKVRDGKFEFTVKSMKCGVDTVGDQYLNEKAQGQFCLVTLKVKNIGKEAQMFSDSDQKAYAADGTEYSSDTAAGLYANKDASTFLNEINPGNQITGVLVYDVPKKTKLVKLELHDSMFSGGVTVSLG